jgi:hypothetical protein
MRPDKLVAKCGGTGQTGFFSFTLAGGIRTLCISGPDKNRQTFMNMLFVAYDDVADSYYMGISGTNGMCGQAFAGVRPCSWFLSH